MEGLLAVAFPSDCALCGEELTSGSLRICGHCWFAIVPWRGPCCVRCGLPFPSPHALDASSAECGLCRVDEMAVDGARNFGIYAGKLRQIILRMKFGRDERLGGRLGEMLMEPWEALPRAEALASPLIVPVPLHPSRQRERGYNQSALLAAGLARALARRTSEPAPRVVAGCLSRHRATPPQTGLSVAARRENLRGAFAVCDRQAVRGRVVVLVDDVMTTGATLAACARELKRAGAARVLAVTLARATPQFPDLIIVDVDNTVDGLSWEST